MWEMRKMPGSIIDITPSSISDNWLLNANLDDMDPSMGHCKGMEIASWLSDHAKPDARYVIIDTLNPAITEVSQWFERTLDDSANKRISVPEGFLATDGILDLCINVVDGLVVYPKVIEKRLMSELPFMATENIMMDAVKAGGDRQELHEKIRELSMEAGKTVKVEGKDNNLLDLIAADPAFPLTIEELQASMDPTKYVGCSAHQVDKFLAEVVKPILDANKGDLGLTAEINV